MFAAALLRGNRWAHSPARVAASFLLGHQGAAAKSVRRRTDAAGAGHALIDRRRAAFGQHADIAGALDPEMADPLVCVAVIPLTGALP
jgi:hypothetical protein